MLKMAGHPQSRFLLALKSKALTLIRNDAIAPCVSVWYLSSHGWLWNTRHSFLPLLQHKLRSVLHSSARQVLAAFSGPWGSLSTYSLCSNKQPPDGWPRCEAHIWKLSLVLAQAFRLRRCVCVRYSHTLPGDPHTRPHAGHRSWELAAGFRDSVLG